MRRLLLAAVAALAFPGSALADPVTLHPVGHGQDSHASWRAQQGLRDDRGDANQALYLENSQRRETHAAAHVEGLEGLRADLLTGLQYLHRRDSVCNVIAPRWAIFVRGRSGREYVANLGCATSPPGAAPPGWVRRFWAQPVIRTAILRAGGTDAFRGTITGLALVLDRSVGVAWIDNVVVQSRFDQALWTYAGDNGAPTRLNPFTATQLLLLGAEPTDWELLTTEELLATLTEEERALVNEDADPVPPPDPMHEEASTADPTATEPATG